MSIRFHFFKKLSSSNDYAKKCPLNVLPKLIIADEQTQGKGRKNNKWLSHPGDICCSYVTSLPRIIDLTGLSVLVGLKIAEYCNNNGETTFVKWPNDIVKLIKSPQSDHYEKVSGILIETIVSKDHQKIIVGLGLNLNEKHNSSVHSILQTKTYGKIIQDIGEIIHLIMIELNHQQRVKIDSECFKKFDILNNKAICYSIEQPENHTLNVSLFTYKQSCMAQGISESGELQIYDTKTDTIELLKNAYNIELMTTNDQSKYHTSKRK